AWLIYSKTCALFNKALVGIQPQLRHIPPSSAASMTAVFKPNWEARIAATYPPGPLPTTITSNLVEDILIYFNDSKLVKPFFNLRKFMILMFRKKFGFN